MSALNPMTQRGVITVLVVVLSSLAAGCDATFDPVRPDTTRWVSVHGVLRTDQPVHTFRLEPIRSVLDTTAWQTPITLWAQERGGQTTVPAELSIVRGADGNVITLAHLPADVRPGSGWTVEVSSDEGPPLRISVDMPVEPTLTTEYSFLEGIGVRHLAQFEPVISRPDSLRVIYHIEDGLDGRRARYTARYASGYAVVNGQLKITLNVSRDVTYARAELSPKPDSLVVREVMLDVGLPSTSWFSEPSLQAGGLIHLVGTTYVSHILKPDSVAAAALGVRFD